MQTCKSLLDAHGKAHCTLSCGSWHPKETFAPGGAPSGSLAIRHGQLRLLFAQADAKS